MPSLTPKNVQQEMIDYCAKAVTVWRPAMDTTCLLKEHLHSREC
jgi:hypothetical protein